MTKKIGIALGSGAARGFAHIGVLKALDKEEIPIDFIAGTSAGALMGAIYASGVSPREMEEIVLNIDKRKAIALFTPTIPYSGLVEGSRIIKFVESIIGRQNIGDLNIPFAVVATELFTGKEVVITKGSLPDALRASISIPGIFSPAKYNGKFLVDGGLVNPIPVDTVRNMGANIVIAVNVLPPPQRSVGDIEMKQEKRKKQTKNIDSEAVNIRLSRFSNLQKSVVQFANLVKKKTSSPSIFSVILQTIGITNYQISSSQLSRYKPDFLITPSVEFIGPFEFSRAGETILAGEKAIIPVLPEIKEKMKT